MSLPADRRVLVAFGAVVVLGGSNLVLVIVTTRELEPLWSAAVRFSGAAVLALAGVAAMRLPMPSGRALAVAMIYGALAFFLGFALFYWGTQRVPAGVASVIMGAVPLLTFLLACAQGIEPFRARARRALLAITGVAVISPCRARRSRSSRCSRSWRGCERRRGCDRRAQDPGDASARGERGRPRDGRRAS